MKVQPSSFNKLFFGFLFLCLIAVSAIAQKLPSVQTTSLRAPDNIKVDGKAIEWDNKLQAYNHSTDMSYTISNDDDFLYLTIQATEPDNINKIYNGGLSFGVDKTGKKSDKDAMSVTYPVYSPGDKFHVSIAHKPMIDPALPASIAKADSFMNANNKLMSAKAKYIRVAGIKDVDTLISVYNNDGIKAATQFNNKMVYTMEIGISLKNLGLSVNDAAKFSYHVQLHSLRGYQNFDNMVVTQVQAPNGRMVPNVDMGNRTIQDLRAMAEPTDFWGEYTLIKK